MSVHITYTGGTIGMVDSPRGLVPGADLESWLADLLDGTDLGGQVTLTGLDPLIDSSNAAPGSWQQIIEDLRTHHADRPAQGYVVLHGTDTMAYTSAALSYALADFDRPVVITGSQLPLGVVGSDAAPNVTGALRAATSRRAVGVSLFFGHHLLAGNRATKTSPGRPMSWSCSPAIAPPRPAHGPSRASPPPTRCHWPSPARPGNGHGPRRRGPGGRIRSRTNVTMSSSSTSPRASPQPVSEPC